MGFKKVIKTVAGGAVGFLTGGPVGAAVGAGGALLGEVLGANVSPQAAASGAQSLASAALGGSSISASLISSPIRDGGPTPTQLAQASSGIMVAPVAKEKERQQQVNPAIELAMQWDEIFRG